MCPRNGMLRGFLPVFLRPRRRWVLRHRYSDGGRQDLYALFSNGQRRPRQRERLRPLPAFPLGLAKSANLFHAGPHGGEMLRARFYCGGQSSMTGWPFSDRRLDLHRARRALSESLIGVCPSGFFLHVSAKSAKSSSCQASTSVPALICSCRASNACCAMPLGR